MKSDFLKEKGQYEKDADQRISQMKDKANHEAVHCLVEHTQKISEELQTQHKGLLREHQITKDLKKLRKIHVENAA